jgi:hypothetical protein
MIRSFSSYLIQEWEQNSQTVCTSEFGDVTVEKSGGEGKAVRQ